VNTAWMAQAKCKDRTDIEFFPESGQVLRKTAKFCSTCPVREQCLDYAVDNGLDYGYWGGLSANQRMLARRRARR